MKQPFTFLNEKFDVKIWRIDNELLLPDCIQQMNTGDGGKVGISGSGPTTARIFEGTYEWDVIL